MDKILWLQSDVFWCVGKLLVTGRIKFDSDVLQTNLLAVLVVLNLLVN
jgi:hypothetical protein